MELLAFYKLVFLSLIRNKSMSIYTHVHTAAAPIICHTEVIYSVSFLFSVACLFEHGSDRRTVSNCQTTNICYNDHINFIGFMEQKSVGHVAG
jgi:hypothetical protein